METHALVVGLVLAICSSATALYSASSPVIELTESNFEAKIKNSGFMLVEVRDQAMI